MNKRRIIILLGVVFIIGMVACKKNNDAPSVKLVSHLNIINASTDTVNLYLNGSRLNNNSNLYPLYSSGYLQVPAFAQNFQVKKLFNQATNTVQQLFSIPVKLDTSKYYSLFIAGETQAQAFTTVDPLHTDTTSRKCLVRFVNASSDTTSRYDMVIGSAPKITGQKFGTASNFSYADTSSVAPIALFKAGSTDTIAKFTLSLLEHKWYTVYTTGKLGGAGSAALGLVVMVNFN